MSTVTDEALPFVQYVREDKSKYKTATDAGYRDIDNDFLIGNSGGFLFNIDFTFANTRLLRPAASSYEKFGYYTDLKDDTPPHRRFRIQEEYRRKNGFTARCKLPNNKKYVYNNLIKAGNVKEAQAMLEPLHITGEHYNFINYGIISKLDEGSVTVSKSGKVSGEKKDGVPIFFGSQYWWYKSKEFAKYNGFHLIVGKARRAGFSYMEAVGSASTVNLNPFCTVIHAASELKYLVEGRSITRMSQMQLEHYEANTPFKRGMISRKISDMHLGFKTKKGGNAGYQSHLLSLATATNPDVAVGKDAIEIKCEELSTFDNFDEFIDVTEPTTRTGSVTTGSIIAWGTGGSKNGKWEVFERNFYNPKGYNFMPFENIWDKDSRDRTCGFYKPYVESLQGFTSDGRASMDADGNTNYEVAMEISRVERAANKTQSKTIADYILHCGQYSNMPSESFSSTVDNIFASEALTEHINNIRHNPDYKFYTDGMLSEEPNGVKFKSNFKLHDEGFKTHPYIEDVPPQSGIDMHGCIRMFHHPFRDPLTGKVPDIYHISYDPVGMDKDNPNSTNSYNSITVWMNPNKYMPHIRKLRVANFFGRPSTMEESDRIAYMLCMYFGGHPGIMLAEVNRGETKSNFKKFGAIKLLDKEPVVVWDSKIKPDAPTAYGIKISNDIRLLQGLRLLKEMLYEEVSEDEEGNKKYVLQTISDISFLLELQKWHNDGNFDRVSDAIVEAFAHKKLHTIAAIKLKTRKTLKESVLTRAWF